jgi:putative transposase
MPDLVASDRAEEVAIFRSQVIGSIAHRELSRGELKAALRQLSHTRFRSPGSAVTRTISVPTLERWYYRYRRGGLAALHPKPRNDRGRAKALTEEQRSLLLDIRREHPSASVTLIVRTLVADGRLARGAVSPATVRRLYREHGLDKVSLRAAAGGTPRLRWQAERPGALWHGDVCHGPTLYVDGLPRPLRIHGLLDDCSRYVVALEAHHTEREVDMLDIFVAAIRRHGRPAALYLDNGSTYRGAALEVACARLGIALVHAQPYDPQARGKMERFWRTLREGCLDYLGTVASLADVNTRLKAFLERHYHGAPHSSLMGQSPESVWRQATQFRDLDDKQLRDALTTHEQRRVRKDSTLSIDGIDWELDQGFLAGRCVTVGRCLIDNPPAPWVEHEGKRLPLHRVDAAKNAVRRRRPRTTEEKKKTPFDPPTALLNGRKEDNP